MFHTDIDSSLFGSSFLNLWRWYSDVAVTIYILWHVVATFSFSYCIEFSLLVSFFTSLFISSADSRPLSFLLILYWCFLFLLVCWTVALRSWTSRELGGSSFTYGFMIGLTCSTTVGNIKPQRNGFTFLLLPNTN